MYDALRRRAPYFEQARIELGFAKPQPRAAAAMTLDEILAANEPSTLRKDYEMNDNAEKFNGKQLAEMKGSDLLDLHNSLAEKPLKRFKNIADGLDRTTALLKAAGRFEGRAKKATAAPAGDAAPKREKKQRAQRAEGEAGGNGGGRQREDYNVRATDAETGRMQAESIRTRVYNKVKESRAKNGVKRSAILEAFPDENADNALSYLVRRGWLEIVGEE
jgi:hypothetical protein